MTKDQLHNSKPSTGLYMVGTPIGNLEDLGFRALRILTNCDWVAAEDTRETRKLLDHYAITGKQIYSFHEHSTRSRIEELVSSLRDDKKVGACVSDAGTPGICDPGAELVRACVEAGVSIHPVPGASAPVSLLSVAGFTQPEFSFHGFFPREKKDRETWARKASLGGQHLFFESPHRILSTLEFLAGAMPAGGLVVGRELTKRFETITRGTCGSVWDILKSEEPRGEYVLAIELPVAEEQPSGLRQDEIFSFVKELALLGASQKVLLRAAMSHGLRKNEAYKLALEVLEK